MRKIKEFLKKVNPYMLGSAAIVAITICLIVWLIYDGAKGDDIPLHDTIVAETVSGPEENAESDTGNERETESQVTEDMLIIQATASPVKEPQKAADAVMSTEVVHEKAEDIKEVMVSPPKVEETVPEPEQEKPEEVEPEPPAEVQLEPEAPEISEPTPKPPIEPTPEPPEIIQPTPEPPKECNHSFVFDSYYQEPTCSNGGLENQVCVHCGMSQTTPGTPTGQHSFEVETAGDCVSEEVVICKDCNYRETGSKNSGNHIDVEAGFCYGCGTKLN